MTPVSRIAAGMMPRRAARARWRRTLRGPRPHRVPRTARLRRRLAASVGAAPRSSVAFVAAGAGTAGWSLAGPVAGFVLATYGGLATVTAQRRSVRRREDRSRRAAVDAVAALAAELRAGLPVETALAATAGTLEGAGRVGGIVGADAIKVARRVGSAVHLARTSGAPLADVLDRLDGHLRAVDRARGVVSAHAAGARASAMLLAVLPAAGPGICVLIGIDPVRVLLHTPLGGGCLALAVVLQLVGLAWSVRLSTVEVPA